MKSRPEGSYRLFGVVGYLAAVTLVSVLAGVAALGAVERAIVLIAPPAGFLLAVKGSELLFGVERIVFYEKLLVALALTVLALIVAGGSVATVTTGIDLVTLGVGTFLAFGRIGCFRVACCHGRPARWGVRYSSEHADAGFPRRWVGRPVFPIQLVDGLLSAALVAIGSVVFASGHRPGAAAAIYFCGYGAGRFVLELFRGDAARPTWGGVSEAQWTAVITTWAVVLLLGPAWPQLVVAGTLTAGALVLVAARRRLVPATYWLTSPAHLREIDLILRRATSGMEPDVTSFGLRMSLHVLPGGRIHDYILTHTSLPLTPPVAQALARQLGLDAAEVRAGATPGLIHVLVGVIMPG